MINFKNNVQLRKELKETKQQLQLSQRVITHQTEINAVQFEIVHILNQAILNALNSIPLNIMEPKDSPTSILLKGLQDAKNIKLYPDL